MKRIAISTIAFAAGIGIALAQAPSPGQSTPGAQAPGAQRSGGAGAAQPGRDRNDATRGQGAQGQGQRVQGRGQSDRAPVQPEDQGARQSQPGAPQSGAQQRQQSQPQGQSQQGQGNQSQTSNQSQTGGNVTLTNEQRTEVRQTILQGSNAPRVDSVNFSISVGTAVPTSVRVVEVPETLVRIRPAWRGFSYFVVRDQIIVIDRDHKIVAVLNV